MKIEKHFIPIGYLRAKSQASIILTISFNEKDTKGTLAKLRKLSRLMPKTHDFSSLRNSNLRERTLIEFSQLLYNFYSNCDYPVADFPTIYPLRSNNNDVVIFNCICYSHTPRGFLNIGNWICTIIQNDTKNISNKFKQNSAQIIKNVDAVNLLNRMNRGFVRAGVKFKMPIRKVPGPFLQFGWGKHSFQLEGPNLERTSRNAAVLARNKSLSHRVLKRGGFPVPNELKVINEESCKKFVKEFGFPVVVKPSDKDQAVGVTANISDLQELTRAYAFARKQSRNILIQNHVEGKEFRLNIVNGKLVWCYEKHPASVTGDGVSTVLQLIQKENLTPKRSNFRATGIKKIEIHSRLKEVLEQQGSDLRSIPNTNEIIYLNRTGGISSGGSPIIIPISLIHPDNILMAERLSKLFQLDIIGLDFITVDIRKSWMNIGGKILEVNSYPAINHTSQHIYDIILKEFVSGDGRGASAVILSDNFNKQVLAGFVNFCEKTGRNAGIIIDNNIMINNTIITKATGNAVNNCKILCLDKSIDYLILVSDGSNAFFNNGLGLDEFDCLCFEREFDSSYEQRLRNLGEAISGEIAQNNRLKTMIKIDNKNISKRYKNLSEYLIMNMPFYDKLHRQKFKPIASFR